MQNIWECLPQSTLANANLLLTGIISPKQMEYDDIFFVLHRQTPKPPAATTNTQFLLDSHFLEVSIQLLANRIKFIKCLWCRNKLIFRDRDNNFRMNVNNVFGEMLCMRTWEAHLETVVNYFIRITNSLLIYCCRLKQFIRWNGK